MIERLRVPVTSMVLATGLILGTSGCAILESVSQSASSPFEWLSNSSGSSSGGGSAYREDVSEVTVAFATEGGDVDAFRRHVGRLAAERGVTSWEDDPATCAGIGEGVRRARLDRDEATRFGERLFGDRPAAIAAYDEGYASLR